MSKINVSTITNRTGTSGPVLSGVTTATNGFNVTGGSVGIGTDNPTQVLTVRAGSTPQILLKTTDATPAFFVGDSNRTGAGQHLLEYRGNWNGTNVARIIFAAGADTTNKDDGIITFNTASAGSTIERLRILSDGAVIVGDGTNWAKYVSDANFQITDNTNAKLVISNPGNATYSLAVGTNNDLIFKNESTAADSMVIDYTTNNLELVDGNLKLASGKGIDFSATSDIAGATSELLDDYEEGTWTPTVVGLTGLDSASGTYVKIGNLVTVGLFVNIGTKTYIGSGSGGTTIQFPLPFNSSGASNAYFGASVGNLRYIDFSGNSAEQFCANIGGTNNILYGRWLKNNSNFTDVTLGDLYNSFSIHMSVTYRTA